MYNVYNHNGTLLGTFSSEKDANTEAQFYTEATGNEAFVEFN
jgi:hypothetical protein